jgi:hypothetical protein
MLELEKLETLITVQIALIHGDVDAESNHKREAFNKVLDMIEEIKEIKKEAAEATSQNKNK